MPRLAEYEFIQWILSTYVVDPVAAGGTYLSLPFVQAGLKNDFKAIAREKPVHEKARSLRLVGKVEALCREAYQTVKRTS
jgi:hypothetical protein